MLKLIDIKKDYLAGSNKVQALKGITLNFRKNEFVSILGPSGCGKTTLLNIIGGLDKYTEGDLVINGKSTKEFTSRSWDVYRNHRIGFIFQSYNLIPHQTILENVELSLTIAGVDKKTRTEKAKKALDRVGLSGQYKKRPNQLSGGQCQRVAIARALVNEPDILLADEPTGALDTVTSGQIMDLIKEISKDKLVIMVTHNPEIALKYSTRIVRLLDGNISSDSNPCDDEEENLGNIVLEDDSEMIKTTNNEKAKMSIVTAFKLSFRNLLSKMKRTLLVGLAGSIGIIGISLVLAISSGITGFIERLQEDMLSGNPITITEKAYDINAMVSSMKPEEKSNIVREGGYIYINSILEVLAKRAEQMNSILVTNEINEDYVKYLNSMPKEYLEAISYGYGLDLSHNIYTDFSSNGTSKQTSLATIKNIYKSILLETEFKDSASMISSLSQSFTEVLPNKDYVLSQYDFVAGSYPQNMNEILVVVNKDNELSDLTLAQLGYYTEEEFLSSAFSAFDPENPNYDKTKVVESFSIEKILSKEFRWYKNDDIFTKNDNTDLLKPSLLYPFFYDPYKDSNEGVTLKVCGIIKPKEGMNYGSLSSGFFYTPEFTKYILENNKESQISSYLKEHDNKIDSIHSIRVDKDPITNELKTIETKAGIVYEYDYFYETEKKAIGLVGSVSIESMLTGAMSSFIGGGTPTGNLSQTNMCSLSLREVGGEELPNSISIYPVDFDEKDKVLEYLDAWNSEDVIVVDGKTLTKEERSEITYTDALSLVIDMINTMIKIISISLICFTAISLVVSTVMIGIITYVSVVERTKEIGVIRSLGGRKKDVAHLFNAETFIIGAVSGLIGIGITLLLQMIGNIIIGHFTDIKNLISLKLSHALIMISISILLTLISGFIPSRAAAKLDPVNALRSE